MINSKNNTMKKNNLILTFLVSVFILSSLSATYARENKSSGTHKVSSLVKDSIFYVDKIGFTSFFKQYPKFEKYRPIVETIYKNRNYNTIWYDDKNIGELSSLLYSKVNSISKEFGNQSQIEYKDEYDHIFNETAEKKPSKMNTELLLTCLYIYYADKVYNGLDKKKVRELGWYLPKKEISYEDILDAILISPKLLDEKSNLLFSQYYKLEEALKKYRNIEKNTTWENIPIDSAYKEYKPFDTAATIALVRNRLFILGDLEKDSKNTVYDEEMMAGVLHYKKRHGLKLNYTLAPEHLRLLNTPINELVETILINMERCRWIPPAVEKEKEYLMINIPSFKLVYVKDGKYALESNIFVGSRMHETVIFSAMIDRIVFSPYWTIPSSIVQNELKIKMEKDPTYLEKENIELKNGVYRQKPGPKNSLGLVKFMFPNPNDIYMHDTPAKNLFSFETRTFSHGCINVEKARELAIALLQDDPKWPVQRIDEAMSGKEETLCMLQNKIPIYIGYFTAWVNDEGDINFYSDIYNRDDRLKKVLQLE